MNAQGTAPVLYLQNGTTPDTLISVPQKRKAAIDEGWTKNSCFVGMGSSTLVQFYTTLKVRN